MVPQWAVKQTTREHWWTAWREDDVNYYASIAESGSRHYVLASVKLGGIEGAELKLTTYCDNFPEGKAIAEAWMESARKFAAEMSEIKPMEAQGV